MISFSEILGFFAPYSREITGLFIIVVSVIIFYILLKIIQRYLLKKVKTKKQVSNINIFLGMLKFLFIFFLVMIVIAFY